MACAIFIYTFYYAFNRIPLLYLCYTFAEDILNDCLY